MAINAILESTPPAYQAASCFMPHMSAHDALGNMEATMVRELATPAVTTTNSDAWLENERLVDGKTVQRLTGMSRTSLYRLVRAGKCPAPVHPTPGRNMWRLDRVRAWKDTLDKPQQ